MNNSDRDDPAWQTAWGWVIREHERPLSAEERGELVRWLQADPAHRKKYEEASHVWLLSALVPPEDDTPDPHDR